MKWFTYPQVKETLSPSIAYWLFEVKQLGKALCLLDSSFELHLHKQRFTTLSSEDKQLLNTTDTQGIERIISHHLGHQEVVLGVPLFPIRLTKNFVAYLIISVIVPLVMCFYISAKILSAVNLWLHCSMRISLRHNWIIWLINQYGCVLQFLAVLKVAR